MAQDESVSPSPSRAQQILYSERQPVPFTWWLGATGVVALISYQAQMQREIWAAIACAVVFGALALWLLLKFSRTTISVIRESDGEIWLHAGDAQLPASVVSRSLVIPPTAKQAAMGRQLDPAAFVVHKPWIPTMAMFVLDDADDPTPYWLISTKEPQALVDALGRPVY
ncbi:DUF3093 domain-containing protein [Corynebacterium sp. 320]|uniref:DUF3093 domain-containing protein n=1 Tax=Corynebacterium TaxID=1716 RepID=UPI00125CB83C|nr:MULTISPECIES: DUF3093 domain-containing protein [Corynebacterium]KAB1503742.1 DUF3093 domain-containing protein [Corynebacterium sp. 320]KAB1553158.1 DUF3093 domain-containing protein [Corynebacterium sp. 321]KAB1553624.1 DUF3093 domain-containing protein [Corynebacterium sp. 319]KAB3527878.1 DUF3093 domain-containing protein [Corynebacterium sp. 250]KAB3540633.1 DUF3093 domain-containing protein [Corynebacterium sp. 366]